MILSDDFLLMMAFTICNELSKRNIKQGGKLIIGRKLLILGQVNKEEGNNEDFKKGFSSVHGV